MRAMRKLRERLKAKAVRASLSLLSLAVLAYAIGFVVFTATLDRKPVSPVPTADGIVALTGGPDRINAAYRLLEEKKGRRLLITGVHPEVGVNTIKKSVPGEPATFDCCVDIGRQASDTIGNASETAEWVNHNQYRSIILVTSSYHLPRALVELKRAMPGVEVTPYPVFQSNLHLDGWWAYPGTTRLLVSEYTKYLLALAHARALLRA